MNPAPLNEMLINHFAPIPKARLLECRVTLTTNEGVSTYDGLFHSTCDAVMDAQTRVGMRPCKVSVKALP